jgi:hypothetical protein
VLARPAGAPRHEGARMIGAFFGLLLAVLALFIVIDVFVHIVG